MFKLTVNNRPVDLDYSDLGFRLNRILSSTDELGAKGGDFSTTITLPLTKTNSNVLPKISTGGYRKFTQTVNYSCTLFYNNQPVLTGTLKLLSMSKDGYRVEIVGGDIDFVNELDNKTLNDIGKVNNEFTWTVPFEGISTANMLNALTNTQTDICFPTIQYNNTPLTDYLNIPATQIFGTYDTSGNQLAEPIEFPNNFKVLPGFFAWYQGLTFEDFPPAVYYKNLLVKCFQESGYTPNGQIFNEDWFNKLIVPYVGEGYKWNWRTLAELRLNHNLTDYTGDPTLTYNYELDNLPLAGSNQYIFGIFDAFFNDIITTRVDRVANYKKWGTSGNEYIVPSTGRYKINIQSEIKRDVNTDKFTQTLHFSGTPNHQEMILVIMRKDESGEFSIEPDVLNNIGRYITQGNNTLISSPSDVIAYYSPYRNLTLPSNDLQVSGTPLSNFTDTVKVNSFSYTTSTPPDIDYDVYRAIADVDIEVEIDLNKNERVYCFWYSLIRAELTTINGDTLVECRMNELANTTSTINFTCGLTDLNIANNLPAIPIKEFIGNFVNFFNLSFETDHQTKTVNFYSRNDLITPTIVDITPRVVRGSEIFTPITNVPQSLTVGYDNDTNDRLLNETLISCELESSTRGNNYANVEFFNNTIYNSGIKKISNGFSATRFTLGTFELVDVSTQVSGIPVTITSGAIPPESILAGYSYASQISYQGSYMIPNIQSEDSYKVSLLQDLDYRYDYSPRIFYNEGLASNNGINGAFKVNAFDPDYLDNNSTAWSNGWLFPTQSSFDGENFFSTRTLRFDGPNGLYPNYYPSTFNDSESHYLDLEVLLTTRLWKELRATTHVKYKESLYLVQEIKDYDVTGQNPTKITLLKIS